MNSGDLLASHALPWLIAIDSGKCMDAIEKLEEVYPERGVKPEIVVQLFWDDKENYPLLLEYLERRIFLLVKSLQFSYIILFPGFAISSR